MREARPRFYAIVCERLGVTANETVFLDDLPANVDAARTVGMTAIRFTDNRQAIVALERALCGLSLRPASFSNDSYSKIR